MTEQESDSSSREEQFLSLFLPQEIDAVDYIIKNHKSLVVDVTQNVLDFFSSTLNDLSKTNNAKVSQSELVC
jgi:hypothetical protein